MGDSKTNNGQLINVIKMNPDDSKSKTASKIQQTSQSSSLQTQNNATNNNKSPKPSLIKLRPAKVKPSDRSSFLTRLGSTNKTLYEEYLKFKNKNILKKPYTQAKFITPTKYKKKPNEDQHQLNQDLSSEGKEATTLSWPTPPTNLPNSAQNIVTTTKKIFRQQTEPISVPVNNYQNLSQGLTQTPSLQAQNDIALNRADNIQQKPSKTITNRPIIVNASRNPNILTLPLTNPSAKPPSTSINPISMNPCIKQIQQTLSAIHDVYKNPETESTMSTFIPTQNKINSSNSVNQIPKKTFRDKATMAKDRGAIRSFQSKLSRLKRKNDLLKAKIKVLQKQVNQRQKPLYEQVDRIEKLKDEGNTQAIFLHEQIQNFEKKKISFSMESMTIYTVLFKRSLKGYNFLKHYNILGMPSHTTVKRFIKKDGNFNNNNTIDEHQMETS